MLITTAAPCTPFIPRWSTAACSHESFCVSGADRELLSHGRAEPGGGALVAEPWCSTHQSGTVAHAFNLSTQEVGAGGHWLKVILSQSEFICKGFDSKGVLSCWSLPCASVPDLSLGGLEDSGDSHPHPS